MLLLPLVQHLFASFSNCFNRFSSYSFSFYLSPSPSFHFFLSILLCSSLYNAFLASRPALLNIFFFSTSSLCCSLYYFFFCFPVSPSFHLFFSVPLCSSLFIDTPASLPALLVASFFCAFHRFSLYPSPFILLHLLPFTFLLHSALFFTLVSLPALLCIVFFFRSPSRNASLASYPIPFFLYLSASPSF